MRGWRRRAPRWPPARPACSRSWAWARAPRARRFRPTGRSPTTSANFSTVQNDFALSLNAATRSTWPAACSAAGRGRHAPRPSNRPPTWPTRGCCWRRPGHGNYFNLRSTDIELDVLALHRAAAPRAGAGHGAPRPGRHLGPGRGAAAGAAGHHADAGRRAEEAARAVRARAGHAHRHAAPQLRAGGGPARDHRRPRCRWACRRKCCSAAPTSPRPNAPWPRPTRRSAWPARPSTRASRISPSVGVDSRTIETLFDAPQPAVVGGRVGHAGAVRRRPHPRQRRLRQGRLRRHRGQLPPHRADRDAGSGRRHHRPVGAGQRATRRRRRP
jgi:multidrug efflux system outer membrane protein